MGGLLGGDQAGRAHRAGDRTRGRLAGEHALRGADAVHLASLLAVGGAETVFAVWDQRLRAGARTAGVRLAPADAGS